MNAPTISDASDYSSVTFPHETSFTDGQLVRLFGVMSGKVFGVSYYRSSFDGSESMSQALTWSVAGIYANGEYPQMNLMPAPGAVAQRVSELEAVAQAARDRLASYPDAPPEWRAGDERTVSNAEEQIAKLLPPMAEAA